MFGHDWLHAEATIVARDGKTTGDGMVTKYTFVADVTLASGEVLRATFHEPTIAIDFWAPEIGDRVSVLVRESDRKVRFDKDDARVSGRAHERAQTEAFRRAQDAPPGTPPPSPQI